MHAFLRLVVPLTYEFKPELLVVAAGFDAGIADPVGGCAVTPACYGHLAGLLQVAAGGRMALVLEGGYNLSTTSQSIAACLRALQGRVQAVPSAQLSPAAASDVQRTMDALAGKWRCCQRPAAVAAPSRPMDYVPCTKNPGARSETPFRDSSCCCHPLTGVPYLPSRTTQGCACDRTGTSGAAHPAAGRSPAAAAAAG